jgi:hypothetical protein
MIRTKAALAVAACLAGVVSGSIAGAQASSTGATGTTGSTGAAATITVNGSGALTVDSSASATTIQASYLTALGSALSDAHTKAASLAGSVGDTLGAVENITEQSNDNGGACYGPLFAAAGTAKGAPVPAVSPGSKKRHKPATSKPKNSVAALPDIARISTATVTSCSLQADITVTYAMAPA